MKYFFIAILSLLTVVLPAQVKTDKSIVLVAPDTASRQVTGLALPNDSTSAVNVNAIAYSFLEYYTVSGTNALSFTVPVPLAAYVEGMTFVIKCTSSNTDSVTVNVNALGNKKLLNPFGKKLKFHELLTGGLHKIIYRGDHFVLVNAVDDGCPNNFVDVNENYCIEITEHTATTYFVATKTCYDKNARLCSWNEWYNACQKAGLGLVTMTNNYEFIDDAHDHGSFVAIIGGTGNCQSFSSLNSLTALRTYRCCFRK